jgi:sodium-dependent dicarboxylate transporter 2/3/5
MNQNSDKDHLLSRTALLGLLAGLALFAATLLLPPPSGLPVAGWYTVGLALLMAIWWTTEPVPIAVTALLPVILLPLLGAGDLARATADYASPVVFLFLGGFLLAAAVKRWGLHRRLAYAAVRAIGAQPRRLVLGFMLGTGFLSMWLSNTATVVLMLPVAVSIVAAVEETRGDSRDLRRFSVCLLLGLAYAASIGGMGTLIGTPPNALLAAYLRESRGVDLSFAAWAAVGVPLVLVFLPLAWLLLTRLLFPVSPTFAASLDGGRLLEQLRGERTMSAAERRVGLVFLVAALLWMSRPLLNRLPGLEALSDAGIGLLCGLSLFFIPSGEHQPRRFLMDWQEARGIPWEVLILFGGGLSLAAAIDRSGLALWIGDSLGQLGGLPDYVYLLLVTAMVIVLSELASNTAAVATLLPIVSVLAAATGVDAISLSAAVTLAASCGFMLPIATPPNTLVFATGHVTAAAMARAGLLLNLLGLALVPVAARLLAPSLG